VACKISFVSRRELSFAFIVFFVLLAGASYLVLVAWTGATRDGDLSCLSSIAGAADRAVKAGRLEVKDARRELTNDEIAMVLAEFGVGDCGHRDYLIDELHISVGDVNTVSKLRVRVWTPGPDGVSATADDLVIPWEENSWAR
jgi:hypothetical protein